MRSFPILLFAAAFGFAASAAQLFRTTYPELTAHIGRPCLAELTLDVSREATITVFYVGHTRAHRFWHQQREMRVRKGRRVVRFFGFPPVDLSDVQLRLDVEDSAADAVKTVGVRLGDYSDFFPNGETEEGQPAELLFRASFDGTATAEFAKGGAAPVLATNLVFAPGRNGQALKVADAKSVLAYRAVGNFNPERGTAAFWFKPIGDDVAMLAGKRQIWRSLLSLGNSNDLGRPPTGTGANRLWLWNDRLRGELDSLEGDYACVPRFLDNREWRHVVWTWDEFGTRLFVDGEQKPGPSHGDSPFQNALNHAYPLRQDRKPCEWLYLGNGGGGRPMDGLIDDLMIYSAPLSRERIRCLAGTKSVSSLPDYKALFAEDGPNTHEGEPVVRSGRPELEFVERVVLDRAGVERLKVSGRFASSGDETFARLGDREYLEAGRDVNARYAVRFELNPSVPLHCFEIDYPDDAARAMDFIVQVSRKRKGAWAGNTYDYAMQVGVLTGRDYANTGRIQTHRCLYWTSDKDVTFVAMNARKDAPATTGLRPVAVAEVRVYRVKDGKLPVARTNEPAPVDGWNRLACLFFEDPAIGYDFATPASGGKSFDDQSKMIDRAAAYMKFAGLNLFAYPAAWYEGLIGESYDPRRNHAPDYLSAWYEKFDKEGLFIMPTVNQFRMGIERERGITRRTMTDGSLYATEVAIHDTGYPNWGGWHGTPPNYCVAHPETQRILVEEFDRMIRQGAVHPSFKGICLHISRHSFVWWGDLESGYNDYVIEDFEKRTGLVVPRDRTNPRRGHEVAAWIKANAREAFLAYRAEVLTDFYARLAARLRAAREDLRLWVNLYDTPLVSRSDYLDPLCAGKIAYEGGIDVARLQQAIPNLIVTQTQIPADHRKFSLHQYATGPAGVAWHEKMETSEGFFRHLASAKMKVLHHHDRYWENAIGRTAPLRAPWLDEAFWRVTTLNPSGVHALRHFVEPFRYHDFLGVSKGGYLIGTYGMETCLAPFLQALRSLPAVEMDEVGRRGPVVVRQKDFRGASYFYVVNTDDKPATLKLTVPKGTIDRVTGESLAVGSKGTVALPLEPYDFRSFSAVTGRPVIK